VSEGGLVPLPHGRDIMNTEFDAAPIVTPPRSDADSQRTSVSPLTGQLSMASAAATRITVGLARFDFAMRVRAGGSGRIARHPVGRVLLRSLCAG
jgi:hypothetical protein